MALLTLFVLSPLAVSTSRMIQGVLQVPTESQNSPLNEGPDAPMDKRSGPHDMEFLGVVDVLLRRRRQMRDQQVVLVHGQEERLVDVVRTRERRAPRRP